MSHTEIHHIRESLIQSMANTLHECIDGTETLLLLSGGSSIPVSVAVIARLPKEDKKLITVGMTDERYGPYMHSDSNWRALIGAGVLDLGLRQYEPILTETEETMDQVSIRYEQFLKKRIKESPKSIGIFGIGADDHIAGILPGSTAVHEHTRLVVGYDAGTFTRITMTPPCIAMLTTAFVYAEGQGKAGAISRLDEALEITSHPNQVIKQVPVYKIFYFVES